MADRPIIFSPQMIRAILDGRKSQTRRCLKVYVPKKPFANCHPAHKPRCQEPYLDAYCSAPPTAQNPRGMSNVWCWWQIDERPCGPRFSVNYTPGDRLWLRETWRPILLPGGVEAIEYAADGRWVDWEQFARRLTAQHHDYWQTPRLGRRVSPIHMPRWASRITLVITDVRVQRLQDISEDDARAEGVRDKEAFRDLWDSINGSGAWDADPWVAAISFTVQKRNIDYDL